MYQINMYLETRIQGIRKTVGWYGYILEWIDHNGEPHTVDGYKYEVGVTPNMLILLAVIAALERINRDSEITIYTDSLYFRESYERFLQSWKKNGWRTTKGEQIKNLNLWKQVSARTVRHVIRFEPQYHHRYKNQMVMEIEKRKAAEPKQMNMKGMI